MAFIGQVSARFTASTSGMISGIEKAKKAIQGFKDSAGKAGGSAGLGIEDLASKFGNLPFGIGNSVKSLQTLGQGLGAFKSLAGAAGGAAGGLGGSMGALAASAGPVAAGAAVAAAAIAGMGAALGSIAGDVERTGQLADRLGISFNAMQTLGVAAEYAGGSTEDMARAMTKMQKASNAAAKGNAEAAAAFGTLGISVDQLKTTNPETLFQNVATELLAIEDPALRTATAMQLFGKSGAEILPALAGIAQAKDDMLGLGLAFSEVDVERFNSLDDSFDRLGAASGALGRTLTLPFVGLFDGVANGFAELFGGLTAILDPLLSVLTPIGDVIGLVAEAIGKSANIAGRAIGLLLAPTKAISGALSEVIKTVRGWVDAFYGAFQKAIAVVENFISRIPFIGKFFKTNNAAIEEGNAALKRQAELSQQGLNINDQFPDKAAEIRKKIEEVNAVLIEQDRLRTMLGKNAPKIVDQGAAQRALEEYNKQLMEADPILKANAEAVKDVRKELEDAAKSASKVDNALATNALDEFETAVSSLNNDLSLGKIKPDEFRASAAAAKATFDAEMEKSEGAKKLGDKYRAELDKGLQTPLNNYLDRLTEIANSDLDPADAIKATNITVEKLVTDLGLKLEIPTTPLQDFNAAMAALNSITATSAEQENTLANARAAATKKLLDTLPDAAKVESPFDQLQAKLKQLDDAAGGLNPIDDAATIAEIENRKIRLREEYANKELESTASRSKGLQRQLDELSKIESEFANDPTALQGVREKRAKIEKELADIGAGAVEAIKADRDRVNQLLGRTDTKEFTADIEAIQRERARAQAAFDEAMKSGNQSAADQAEAKLADLQKAEGLAAGGQRKREMDAAGIGDLVKDPMDAIKKQFEALQKFKADDKIGNEQYLRGMDTLFKDAATTQKEITRELSTVNQEPLKVGDIRGEGIAEYLRLASGREDPAQRQRAEQIAKLESIERLLRDQGIEPATILGG